MNSVTPAIQGKNIKKFTKRGNVNKFRTTKNSNSKYN